MKGLLGWFLCGAGFGGSIILLPSGKFFWIGIVCMIVAIQGIDLIASEKAESVKEELRREFRK